MQGRFNDGKTFPEVQIAVDGIDCTVNTRVAYVLVVKDDLQFLVYFLRFYNHRVLNTHNKIIYIIAVNEMTF